MKSDSDAESSPVAFERIAPQRPDLQASARDTPSATSADAASVSGNRFVLGLLIVLLLGGLAMWGLPRLARGPAPTSTDASAPPAQTAPATAASETAEVAAAPAAPATEAWDDPALLQARAAAQAAQAQYQSDLQTLERARASEWAATELDLAAQQAQRATQAFDSRDFATAQIAWEAAAKASSALVQSLPHRLQDALARGLQALEAGELDAATAAFQQALQLEPANAEATRGLQRVERYPAVRAKLDTAFRLEQAGDISGARTALREALALDADSRDARENLARLDAVVADGEFRRHLAAALAALDQGQLDRAEQSLAQARRLRSQDAGVRNATERLTEARRVARLAQLQAQAAALVSAEDWAAAAASFRAAQQIDASLVFASEGLALAEPRAQLSADLQRLISEPARLQSAAVMQEAEVLLAQARQVDNAGPKLRAQIAALDQARSAAAQPVTVELISDGQTEVTLYRVGRLGRFMSNQASLKPGRYVAIGTRPGYVDVRREFEVSADRPDLRIEIRCEESL